MIFGSLNSSSIREGVYVYVYYCVEVNILRVLIFGIFAIFAFFS